MTNYYLLKEYCPHCERGNQIHIGHTGKAFVFRGYRQNDYDNPDIDPIESYTDWMRFIAYCEWPIVNEYGEHVTIDEFKKVVDKNTDNQIEWIRKNKPELLSEYWYDKDGYCFCGRQFS